MVPFDDDRIVRLRQHFTIPYCFHMHSGSASDLKRGPVYTDCVRKLMGMFVRRVRIAGSRLTFGHRLCNDLTRSFFERILKSQWFL